MKKAGRRTRKTVSVVIASYNMGQFVAGAVASALAQTYPVLEVIVLDDGSTDDTKEVMRDLCMDSRVKFCSLPHGGRSKASNEGIRQSAGEFVAFLDADDLWTKDKLEKQMPLFDKADNVGLVYAGVACIDEVGEAIDAPPRVQFTGSVTKQLFKRNFIPASSVVVRKTCLDEMGGFDEELSMGMDHDLWLRLSTKYHFEALDDTVYLWRKWGGQLSDNHHGRYRNGIKILAKFERQFPNLLAKSVINEAWAYTHTEKGHALARKEKRRMAALKEYLTALSYKPDYLVAWKAVAKLVIREQ